jgi:hypothetical protein
MDVVRRRRNDGVDTDFGVKRILETRFEVGVLKGVVWPLSGRS